MRTDSPDLELAKRLLDQLKRSGFQFERAAPGEDGALVGYRLTHDWLDLLHIEGFSCDCLAWRKRRSLLIVPGVGSVERQARGDALTVLRDVLTWQSGA
jgi:hypothetical protein